MLLLILFNNFFDLSCSADHQNDCREILVVFGPHFGNLWVQKCVLCFKPKCSHGRPVSKDKSSDYRKYGVGTSYGITFLINCMKLEQLTRNK